MKNASDFGPVFLDGVPLPRMNLTEVCGLCSQIKDERLKALEKYADAKDLEGSQAAVIMADCESRDVSVSDLLTFANSPRGTQQILNEAWRKAEPTKPLPSGIALFDLRELAVRVLHVVPDRPTQGSVAASPASPSSGTSQGTLESTPGATPSAS